jgi:large subunit ribosomal protein L39e
MARNKSPSKKRRLARAMRRANAVPLWIMLKTGRRVRTSARRRHWRRTKLKI